MRTGNVIGLVVVAAALGGLGIEATSSFGRAPSTNLAGGAGGSNAVTSVIEGFAFAPVRISVGGEVTWRNGDGAPHSVVATDGTFESPLLEGDGRATRAAHTAVHGVGGDDRLQRAGAVAPRRGGVGERADVVAAHTPATEPAACVGRSFAVPAVHRTQPPADRYRSFEVVAVPSPAATTSPTPRIAGCTVQV